METTVAKWGNSIAIRIPSAFANGLRIKDGTQVIMEVEKGNIIIRKKKYDLNELLTDWGNPVGKEVW
jgi:antitoxin MazE